VEALKNLLDFQLEKDVNGLYPCGSTGSGPVMRVAQRKKVAEIVIERVGGRVPVMVHVGAANMDDIVELVHHARDVGADAVGCVTPFYYTVDDEALKRFYSKVADESELPLLLYNIPEFTGVNIKPSLAAELAENPTIRGVKDSSRNLTQLQEYIESLPKDFTILVGTDTLIFPALVLGAIGAIAVGANAFPEAYRDIYSLFKAGKIEEAAKMQHTLNKLIRYLKTPLMAPVHEALRMRGIDSGCVKLPFREMTDDEKATFREYVERFARFTEGQMELRQDPAR